MWLTKSKRKFTEQTKFYHSNEKYKLHKPSKQNTDLSAIWLCWNIYNFSIINPKICLAKFFHIQKKEREMWIETMAYVPERVNWTCIATVIWKLHACYYSVVVFSVTPSSFSCLSSWLKLPFCLNNWVWWCLQ